MKGIGLAVAALGLTVSLQAATRSVTLTVTGWTCGSCASATRIALKKLDGVQDAKTDLEKNEALVTYDDSKVTTEAMIQAIGRLGYKATVENGAAAASSRRANTPAIATNVTTSSSGRASFFEVPLECGAAESLGCGSEAKPILSELDQNSRIAEARINHPGTILAVVWRDPNDRSDTAVEALFQRHHLAAAALEGEAREKALRQFQSEQWYGAGDVDRLSEHEARVIAARLVNRVRSHFDLAPHRLAALTEDLAVVLARHLTLRDEECDTRREVIEQELTKAASKYLNSRQMAELRRAGEQGIEALPGEDR